MASDGFLDKSSLELLLQAARNLPWNTEKTLSPKAEDLLTQLHSALDPSSLEIFRLDDIASMAKDFWSWTARRPDDDALVRIKRAVSRQGDPLNYTVLEVCMPDMPFIVRSVTGACLELSINPILVIHPILDIARDAQGNRVEDGTDRNESYIQIYLDLLDETACERLEAEIHETVKDIRQCVRDFGAMQHRMKHSAIDVLGCQFVDKQTAEEASAFLNWLADDHFTFLGTREYRFSRDDNSELANEEPEIVDGTSFGVLSDPDRFILQRGHEPTIITDEISEFLQESTPIIVSKGSMVSRVHRRVRVDYIGVKQYDTSGQVIGEVRYAGLFTADAYNRMTRDVPLIRKKVQDVIRKTGKLPGSHDESALKHILETYPRDELFQISVDELYDISLAILQLQTRNETRLFVRRDRFDRFISALVYVPKESFNSNLRARIADVLCQAYDGKLTAFYPQYGDAPLARIHFLIDLPLGHSQSPNTDRLEEEISRLARGWEDQMRGLVRAHRLKLPSHLTDANVTGIFNAGYKETFQPEEALNDIRYFSDLSSARPVIMRAYRLDSDPASTIRAKVYTCDEAVELSDCVPVFEDMGLFVSSESGFPVKLGDNGSPYWVHAFHMRSLDGQAIRLNDVSTEFEDAFEAIWTGRSVSDSFNRLVLAIGASWREAALFRTLARYRKQTGMDPGQSIQIKALTANPHIAEKLLKIFRILFDPDLDLSVEDREMKAGLVTEEIFEALDAVASLDEDRVLRRLHNLVLAVKRTSFYQLNEFGEPHDHIAIKIASPEVDPLPDPKPHREIFVWAPHVEGVHLRFGPVARGGLRWSDRQDDFRTEVLGLVKAQQVKNAVIVPVGSKGGFYPKMLPKDGDQSAIRQEGIRAYKTFIGALLQLTDNLVDGDLKSPRRTVIRDEADPYLVVAADKGTASFSDIANEISTSMGFWLGDAFASGGSAGYDHKKMGITARGGWVAVQRHFREMGVNVQTDPVSVIGVGDMSGDVFGNGMLLSKSLHLKAAFNHLHIFIDPNPQEALSSWTERKRLFDLPQSTWQDYNPELISKGGGVFSRSAKKIELSEEIKSFLNTDLESVTPSDLIQLILKAEADLLWFGGIGTYVKAREESNLDVGDKANDTVRVNAAELSVKVIGEGANLGVTQAGRIAFARLGGRINTDAIDNSAGVDSSDHEVNIKILLKTAIERGSLKLEDRNDLLASMTDDVAELVLTHNYDQTGALTVAEASASSDLDSHERLMERLENEGILNRDVEGLPRPEEVRELREAGKGLSRPELAVLLAYAKNTLFNEIVDSNIPDDAFLANTLYNYFPEPLHVYDTALESHRLRREIIATRLANDIVNLGGITFIHRVKERAGTETSPIIRAYVAAKAMFGLKPLLQRIDDLDNHVDAAIQTELRLDLINALRRQVFWLAKTRPAGNAIGDMVEMYQPGVQALISSETKTLSPYETQLLSERVEDLKSRGTPEDLALDVTIVRALTSATDIVDLSANCQKNVEDIAMVFNATGEVFQFDKLRHLAMEMRPDQHWDRLAVRGLVETFLGQQYALVERLAGTFDQAIESYNEARERVDAYVTQTQESFDRFTFLLADIEKAGSWTFAKLVLVANAVRNYIDETESNTV